MSIALVKRQFRLVDPQEIDPMFFEKPYYLAPDENGEELYILLREALAHALIGSDCHLAQQALYILTRNPLRCILRRSNLSIQERHCYHVG